MNRVLKQAWAELGQAQLKLGLDFTLISPRFEFSRFGLIVFGWDRFSFAGLIE